MPKWANVPLTKIMTITFERHGGHIQILLKSLSLQNCRIFPPEPSFSANFTETILMLLIQKEAQCKVTVIQILSRHH